MAGCFGGYPVLRWTFLLAGSLAHPGWKAQGISCGEIGCRSSDVRFSSSGLGPPERKSQRGVHAELGWI